MATEVAPGVVDAVHAAESGCRFVLLGLEDAQAGQAALRTAAQRVAAIRSPDEPTESIVSYSMVGTSPRGPAAYIDFDQVTGDPALAEAIVGAIVDGLDEHGLVTVLDITTDAVEPPPRPPDMAWPPEVTFPADAIEEDDGGSATYRTYDCLTERTMDDLDASYTLALESSGWSASDRVEATGERDIVRWDVVRRTFRRDELTIELYLELASLTAPIMLSAREQAKVDLRRDRTRLLLKIDHDASPRRRPR